MKPIESMLVLLGCDTMKKILNVLTAFILLSTTIPFVFADEPDISQSEVEIDAETQQQTEIMGHELGAEIRLLQLEKEIIKNINTGEEIITILEGFDVNTIDLQVILAELELLLEDVQKAEPNASNAVSIFVDLKYDAVNITKDFRETIRGLLNNTLQDKIQQQTRNRTCNQTQNLSQSIQNKIRQYNSNQFRNIYQHLGENNSECIHRYQNGSMTQNQVRQNITNRINQTGKGNQFSVISSLKQQKIRDRIQSQNQVLSASEGFQQRKQNRLQKRLQKIQDLPDNPVYNQLMKRMQHKLNNTGNNESNGTGGNGSNNGENSNDSGNGQKESGGGKNGGTNGPGGGR